MILQTLVDRVQKDAAFADELVTDYLKLKEQNQTMAAELEETRRMKEESQLALRQARGFSVYLKGKQGSIKKVELERQNSLSITLSQMQKTIAGSGNPGVPFLSPLWHGNRVRTPAPR